MKTQVELLKECCDIKDAACVKYQKRIAELEEENKKLKEKQKVLDKENCELIDENVKLKYNNKLYKERIDEIQIAYMKFEKATDEKYKAFRKAYGDLDQVIMNR